VTHGRPTTVSVEEAGALLGVSRTTAYRLAACGEFPVPVIRIGRKLRIPTALLANALGLRPDDVIELASLRGTAIGRDAAKGRGVT
jgi:excisionase family DNA binding protein